MTYPKGSETPLDALHHAYDAWRATEPQLFLTDEVLWPDTGLDDTHERPAAPHGAAGMEAESTVCVVEPAGFTSGAEPRRDLLGTDGEPSPFASPPVCSPPSAGGSAPPINTTGPHAPPHEGARAAQRRSF